MSHSISNINILNLQNNIDKAAARPSISNGSIISGRVIAQNNNGNYLVSIGGQKIDVRSEVPLLPNQVFTAKVNVKNGIVTLSLAGDTSKDIISKYSAETQSGKLNVQSSAFLQSLGLEPTQQAFNLIQFMQKMGMKIDIPLAKRALQAAKKFKDGNQKEAGEIALLLDEKEIDSAEKTINAVMSGTSDKKENENSRRDKEYTVNAKNRTDIYFDENTGKSFIRDYLKSVDGAAETNKAGVLTAFNSLKNKKQNRYINDSQWIILPFEWSVGNIFGDIRLFLIRNSSVLKKIVINYEKNEQKHQIVLYLEKKKIEKVRISIDYELSDSEKQRYETLFWSIAGKCGSSSDLKKLEFMRISEFDGFGTDDEPLFKVNAFV